MTHAFASESLAPGSTVLDVGAHWLQQAAFFARDGHKLICADIYINGMQDMLAAAARDMGADLMDIEALEPIDTFSALPDNSIDAILFGEIIEHITFNPINMWKGFYRILKPGGHIYITTPNSLHYARLHQKLNALLGACEYGIEVAEIFSHGTRGHHWKEFSIPELRAYFSALSLDFSINRIEARTFGHWVYDIYRGELVMGGSVQLDQLVASLEAAGAQPMGEQILLDVALPAKKDGITIRPPW